MSTYIDLKEAFEDDEFALICKYHPNQVFDEAIPADVRKYSNEDIFVLMRACDYIVTDYSSLALEAAAIGKKTYYYLFDHDRYMRDNGLNIDPKFEMPTCTFERAKDLYQAISSGSYDYEELQRFKEKYLPDDLGHSTDKIVSLIKEIMEKNQ